MSQSLLRKMLNLAMIAVLPMAIFALIVVLQSVEEGRERAVNKALERTRLVQIQLDDQVRHIVVAASAYAADATESLASGNQKFGHLREHDRFLPATVSGVFVVRTDGTVLAVHPIAREFDQDVVPLPETLRGSLLDGTRNEPFFVRGDKRGVIYALAPVINSHGAVVAYAGLTVSETSLAVQIAAGFDAIRGEGPALGTHRIRFDPARALETGKPLAGANAGGKPAQVVGDLIDGLAVDMQSLQYPWSVRTEVPRSSIFQPALEGTLTFAFLAALAMLFAANLAVRTAEGIVAPVSGLRAGARRLAAGDLDHRMLAAPGTASEFAELAGDFNAMAERIATQRAELEAVEERWKLALDGAGHGVFDWNVETRQVYFSPRCLNSLGLAPGDFAGTVDNWVALVHPEDHPESLATWKTYRKGQSDQLATRMRMRVAGGEWRWFDVRGMAPQRLGAQRADAGRLVRIVGTITDIHDRIEAERAVASSNEVFRSVFHESPHPMVVIGLADRKFAMINGSATRTLGYTVEEVVGTPTDALNLWRDRASRERFWAEFAANGRVSDFLAILLSKSGAEVAMLMYASSIEVGGERMCLVQTVDMTEREKAARALAQSRETFHALFDHSPHPLIVISAEDHIVRDVSDSALEVFGYTRDQVVGKATAAVPIWVDAAERLRFLSGITRGERVSGFECRMKASNGSPLHMMLSADFVEAAGEKLLLVQAANLTQIKLLEESARVARAELARANRDLEVRVRDRTLELQTTVDELESCCYSVAHDLRAPLRAINAYLKLAAEHEAAIPEEARQWIGKADASAGRMTVLIDDLLDFARAGRRQVEQVLVDIDHMARDVAGELQAHYPRSQIVIGPLPPATGDAFLLHQLVENLVDNALKFSAESAQPRVDINAEERAGRFIYSVRDNGVGVDARYAGKLFRVFERLHDPLRFRGTGVGLAIAKRIVERHGGRIWHTANPGGGSIFSFTLGGLPENEAAAKQSTGTTHGNPAG